MQRDQYFPARTRAEPTRLASLNGGRHLREAGKTAVIYSWKPYKDWDPTSLRLRANSYASDRNSSYRISDYLDDADQEY